MSGKNTPLISECMNGSKQHQLTRSPVPIVGEVRQERKEEICVVQRCVCCVEYYITVAICVVPIKECKGEILTRSRSLDASGVAYNIWAMQGCYRNCGKWGCFFVFLFVFNQTES